MKYEIDKTYYSVDWIQGHCNFYHVGDFFDGLASIDDRLKFENFSKWKSGFNAYSERYCFQDTAIIQIGYNPALPEEVSSFIDFKQIDSKSLYARVNIDPPFYNTGIFISISGDGLRFLGSDKIKLVLEYLHNCDFICTRMDVACDIFDPNNLYVPLVAEAFTRAFNPLQPFVAGEVSAYSTMPRSQIHYRDNPDPFRPQNNGKTTNWFWGSHKSDRCYFRLYDKWLETKTGRNKARADLLLQDIPSDYWYRFEYEMHQKYAQVCFLMIVEAGETVSSVFSWCAANSFKIIKCRPYTVKTNSGAQSDLAALWNQFIVLACSTAPVPTFDFVQSEFVKDVDRRITHLKNNSAMYSTTIMLLCSLLAGSDRQRFEAQAILEDGMIKSFTQKKYVGFMNDIGLSAIRDDVSDRLRYVTSPLTSDYARSVIRDVISGNNLLNLNFSPGVHRILSDLELDDYSL